MNIFYTFDNNFVPQTAACICSICENNRDMDNIHFYTASCQATEENKNKLIQLVSSYNRKITMIELGEISSYFDIDSSGWAPAASARLLIDKILPETVERVLYLDGDTIVRSSLKDLWNVDLKGNTLAMIAEPTINRKRKVFLNMENYPYCNSGVLLIDLKKWRDSSARERIFDFFKLYDGKLFAPDQDAINGTLKDEILCIPPKYNFYNIFYQYSYSFLKKLMGDAKYINENEYIDSVKNPVIVHYLGEERPWRKGNTHKYKDDYIKYLSKTAWANTPEQEGWELYFFCWNVFNAVTKFTPSIRYKIINTLIPAFIKHRAKQVKK